MLIKNKLITIMMLTCISALTLTGIGFVAWQSYALQKSVIQNLSIQAKIISENCKIALASDDPHYAEEALAKLCANPSITYACIRDYADKVFSTYHRDPDDNSIHLFEINEDGYGFGNSSISILEEIVYKGEAIGTVSIRSDLNPAYIILKHNSTIIIPVLLLASLVAYIVSFKLQGFISKPILKLTDAVKMISENKNYAIRVPKHNNDELSILIGAFNEMLEQIQRRDSALVKAKNQLEIKVKDRTLKLTDANKRLKMEIIEREQVNVKLKETYDALVDASHQAGMMQVATDVLHNVGNVLNSVNISTTLIAEIISHSKVQNFKNVTEMIEANLDDLGKFLNEDSQGKHVPAYLIKISKLLTEEQTDIAGKLESLVENVNHIKEIVNMQQSYSKVSGVEMVTALDELIDNSINVNSSSFERHGIKLIREFGDLPEVNIEKQKLLHILVNLIANAKYALKHSKNEEKLLTVRCFKNNEDSLQIEVADNGMGIPEENLTKIFSHGFTTKEDGNGFGLHSAALAVNEMGGVLSVHSDGIGQGATFRLELQFKPVEMIMS